MSPDLQALPAPPAGRDDALRGSRGFRVRSPSGHLGLVEDVHLDPATGRPLSIAVRAGRIIVLLVPVEEVQDVVAEEGLVVLGPYEARFVPELRRDRIVLTAS